MKKFVLGALGSLLFCSTAMAADMGAPAYDWTGFSVGIEAGYGFGNTHHYNPPGDTGPLAIQGFLGGLNIGYNHQVDNLVFGITSDFMLSGIAGSHGPAVFNPGPNSFSCGSGPCKTNVNWLNTTNLRLGLAADRFLPFVSGGLAIAGVDATIPNDPTLTAGNRVQVGWNIGGGVEMALDDKWTGTLEYKYVDLGAWRYDNNNSNFSADAKFSTVTFALNYRF